MNGLDTADMFKKTQAQGELNLGYHHPHGFFSNGTSNRFYTVNIYSQKKIESVLGMITDRENKTIF